MRVERIQKVNPGKERNLPPFPPDAQPLRLGETDRQRQIDRDKAREREICKRITLSQMFSSVQYFFTSTESISISLSETIRTITSIRDGEPRTATSTFTQLLQL